jgi:2'-5' RNA ligase
MWMAMSWKVDYADFLQSATTLANEDRDFREWHQGIAEYGVWVILIENPAWELACDNAARRLAPFLHKHYLRQPHITIAPCGLMHPDHFSETDLQRQMHALNSTQPCSLRISATKLNSFASAPFIQVDDASNHLASMRRTLLPDEDGSEQFTPHVTIGLYRDCFPTKLLAQELWQLGIPVLPTIEVRELLFCTYQTHDIKGPLSIQRRFPLHLPGT